MAKPIVTTADQSSVQAPTQPNATATDDPGAAGRGTALVVGADVSEVVPRSAAPVPAKRMSAAKGKTTAKLPALVVRFNEWLKGCGEKAEPNFDNQPLGILKTFPKVDAGQVPDGYLEENLWWWRKAKPEKAASIFRHDGVPMWTEILFPIYQDHFERSAYYYELRARFGKRYQWDFGHPWIHCSRQQRRMLGCLWPNDYPAQNWLPSDTGDEWVRLEARIINLKLPDSTLVSQHLHEVEQLRAKHKVQKSPIGQGVRRCPIPWSRIELLDTRRYKLGVLNDSERSQVSKTVEDYKATCRAVGLSP